MDNVLVFFGTDPPFRKELESVLEGYRIIFAEGGTASIDEETAENTVVVFGNPGAAFLKRCPRLKWVQLQSAGTNGYVNGELDDKIILSCATGSYGHAISEHLVGLTFELLKKLHLYRDEQAKGRWQPRGKVKSIKGSVVLVIGMGDIGGEYAKRMKALGSYVIGIRRTAHAKPDFADELLTQEKMEEALPRADIIVLAVPGTKDTEKLIGRNELAKMKKDAILLNVGRGFSVDTEALCDALESGSLGGAGLDVTDPEPLPPGHRLWKIENAVITPHISGGYNMNETGQYIMKLALENASRFVRGELPESLVDFKTGYRISK